MTPGLPITICAAVCLTAVLLELVKRQPPAVAPTRAQLSGPFAGEGCSDDSSGNALLVVIVLAMYFGARAGLGVVAAIARAVAVPPRRVVTGRPAMMVAAIFLGVTFQVVTLRLLVPGPSPGDFTTYGALTPDGGARGWRVERVIDGLRAGPLVELPRLPDPVQDVRRGGGHG